VFEAKQQVPTIEIPEVKMWQDKKAQAP